MPATISTTVTLKINPQKTRSFIPFSSLCQSYRCTSELNPSSATPNCCLNLLMKSSSFASTSSSPSLVLAVLSFVVTGGQASTLLEDEREFDYGAKSEKGPKRWGELKKEWEACKNGEMQSPIDMSHERVRIIRKPEKRHYKRYNATVKNRGHDISVQWHGDAGYVLINGTNYPLQQAHWHSPSEHTVNGRRYDMEMHMVHLNENATNYKIAVTAVLYKIGKPDRFLSKLIRNISSMIDKKDEVKNAGMIDPREIKIGSRKYYRYIGSLTVPPCTEGVIWTIKKKVRTVSRAQVKMLREAVHDYAERNVRPLQPINKRPIYLMAPEDTA